MALPAIEVQGLGKCYLRGGQQASYRTLREDLLDALRHPFRRSRVRRSAETFWALREVSFQVDQGEIVGVIGKNGAGKSTLLKILARITSPTEGRAVFRGRLGSLLEVGTGFHPELTGRENIFLSGAILGMRRAEIQQSFDEIVAFSELEDFLDTPVKHYSSGMYVRLAFAVAAHLRTEILLVDEVLAVGDASFQRKCLAKMDQVAHRGRTVLFVSHNMGAVQRLCQTTLLIEEGRLVQRGPSEEITANYLNSSADQNLSWSRADLPDVAAYFTRVAIVDDDENDVSVVTTAQKLRVLLEFKLVRPDKSLCVSVGLLDGQGQQIFGSQPEDVEIPTPNSPGRYKALVEFPSEMLLSRPYRIAAALWVPYLGGIDKVEQISFRAHETDSFAARNPAGRPGYLTVRCGWRIEKETHGDN